MNFDEAREACKRPDKTPMTDKRKLALKKGELLRTYCNIISQMHRIQMLARDIKAMSDEKVNAAGLYYIGSAVTFLKAQENSLRTELGQISKEESLERQVARSNARYSKYLRSKNELP